MIALSKVKQMFESLSKFTVKHSPEILTAFGITGMLTTVVLAVVATPKAMERIEEEKDELETDELTPIEVVKATWKEYLPATIICSVSVACLIGASATNCKRNAALATAYKLSEEALTEYKAKVVETLGEKKEKQIREEIDKDHLKTNPASKSEVIITDNGNTLCYDKLSGRYFRSDMETIRRAINNFNKTLLLDMYASVNDFYDELDLDHTDVGDQVGWRIDNGLLDLDFSSLIADDGRPCLVVGFSRPPKHDFFSMY